MTEIKQAIPVYGRNIISSLDKSYYEDCIVICAPEAWDLVKADFPGVPKAAVAPVAMEQSKLEAQLAALPQAAVVWGLGGGSACDAAKLYALMRGARLVMVPSILSVDAPFTAAVGVRVGERVRYIGRAMPDHLLVDFDLIQKAPKHLNRAGICDIMSIYTALFDWRLASRDIGEAYNPEFAARSQSMLDRLFAGAEHIRDCDETGLKLIADLYVEEVELCERWGNSRPEEGSEHYFAYCCEWITKRPFIHGELVSFGSVITSLYQGQPIEPIRIFLSTIQLEYSAARMGISEEDVRKTLLALPAYLQEENQLPYGIYHSRSMSPSRASELIAAMKGLRLI